MRNRPLIVATVAVVAATLVGCGGPAAGTTPAPPSIPFSVIPPEPVVQAVFDAAKSGDTSKLAHLCDPTGRNDQDTQDICDLANAPDDSSSVRAFRRDFSKGAIRNTDVTGSKSTIDFTYGPDGTKTGKMTLVQRDEKWYLSGY